MTLPLNKTKIVCTIGPASQSREVMEKLLLAGMNVARSISPTGISRVTRR